jgi:hypothetical protein
MLRHTEHLKKKKRVTWDGGRTRNTQHYYLRIDFVNLKKKKKISFSLIRLRNESLNAVRKKEQEIEGWEMTLWKLQTCGASVPEKKRDGSLKLDGYKKPFADFWSLILCMCVCRKKKKKWGRVGKGLDYPTKDFRGTCVFRSWPMTSFRQKTN